MDNSSLAIYIHELQNQCLYMQAALQVFNQSLEQKAGTGALFAGQAALGSASQIACILWPTRARHRRRGEELRKVLGLPEKHPFADRRISEVFENTDFKLEDWIGRTKNKRIVMDFIGSAQSLQLPDDNIWRLYDPQTKVFVYRGVGYNLQNLARAVADITQRVDNIHRQLMPPREQQGQAAGQPATQPSNDTAPTPPQPAAEEIPASVTEDVAPADAAPAADTSADPAPKKAPAKKAPAAKTATKKPAAKKPAAKKPAAKKDA